MSTRPPLTQTYSSDGSASQSTTMPHALQQMSNTDEEEQCQFSRPACFCDRLFSHLIQSPRFSVDCISQVLEDQVYINNLVHSRVPWANWHWIDDKCWEKGGLRIWQLRNQGKIWPSLSNWPQQETCRCLTGGDAICLYLNSRYLPPSFLHQLPHMLETLYITGGREGAGHGTALKLGSIGHSKQCCWSNGGHDHESLLEPDTALDLSPECSLFRKAITLG